MTNIKFALTISLLVMIRTDAAHPPTCDSDIYCQGEILHTVQMSYLFEDSKTFVDMKMKMKADIVKSKFKAMMDKSDKKPSKATVKKFVDECFAPPGSEFTKFSPTDWKPHPKIFTLIEDGRLKEWAVYLHRLWKWLGRKMKNNIREERDLYSIIYIENPVIVPGGRFREFYYWDSYWIILGLLHSEMDETAKGMIENFAEIVRNHGLIPNGGRIYYVKRSQPPLMIPMVKLYYEFTNDKTIITKNIDALITEFEFWMKFRCVDVNVDGKAVKLARYNVETAGPRPESYREDLEIASRFSSEKERQEFYWEIKSACESGWDFSTRWFVNKGTNKGNLTNTKTRSIIPVDLNAILCWNAELLSEFHKVIGRADKSKNYKNIANQLRQAIQKVMWSEEDGIWFDYDYVAKEKRKYFYPSNFAPLWTGCFDKSKSSTIGKQVIKYMNAANIRQYLGGVPTSLEHSGEQWDFPNAWPPLQHIIIQGLENTNTKETKQMAYDLAFEWIRANFKGYLTNRGMFEKYDSQLVGGYGGGGEYAVQLGFGWTNGVCLDLLHKYGMKLHSTGISGANTILHSWTVNDVTFYFILIIIYVSNLNVCC